MRTTVRASTTTGPSSFYQVVVRCKTSGLRLISYEYATHQIGYAR